VSAAATGHLTRGPHPLLFELLYEPQLADERRHLLPLLLRVDAAHVVMLADQGLLARAVAAALLAHNRDLAARVAGGEDVLGSPPEHRGLYLLYERHYIAELGPQPGGSMHLARSRNDINATLSRLRLRYELHGLLGHAVELLDSLASAADQHAGTIMSGFTHLQPAQPTTLGHYLAGVSSELTRSVEGLDDAMAVVNRSPMGAAAGFGNALPVDPGQVAGLLGFDGVIDNSADAVASRDYAVRVLGDLAMLGITLTRFATDLQAWSSRAYGFLTWPDDLMGGSSAMPQKRNAFVLENLRGQAVRPVGSLVSTLLGMKSVPFSNSVEVSGEATAHLWPALAAASTALRLARLLVERLQVDRARMASILGDRQTTATALAEFLAVRYQLPFRAAHEVAAGLAHEGALASPTDCRSRLEAALEALLGRPLPVALEEVAQATDPQACVLAAEHGGGPGPDSVRRQVAGLRARTEALHARRRQWWRRWQEADQRLRGSTEAAIAGGQARSAG
jgi:argininosuccinate lyase